MTTYEKLGSRNHLFDLVRIFACLWVVMFHWLGNGGFFPTLSVKPQFFLEPFLHDVAALGFLGVDIFFILSGVVIARSVLGKSWSQFLLARLARLYPTYFVATLLTAMIVPFAVNLPTYAWLANLGSFVWLQWLTRLSYYLGASWSLEFELLFYLMVAFVLVLNAGKIGRLKFLTLRFGAWAATIASLLFALSHTRFCNDICTVFEPSLSVLSFSGFAPYFVLGALIANLGRKKFDLNLRSLFIIAVVMTGWQVYVRLGAFSIMSNWLLGVMALFAGVGLMILGQYISLRVGGTWQKTLKLVALMTYPVYLLHESFGLSLISLELKAGLDLFLAYGSTLALVVFLSYLLVTRLDPFTLTQIANLSRRKAMR